MGFTWSRTITSGTDIQDSDVNEIKNNIDTIYSELGINYPGCTGAGWVELPVSANDPIESADFQELRDRLDYGWDNRCPSHDAADYTAYNDAVQTSDNDNHDSIHHNDDNETHWEQHFDVHYNDENTGYQGSHQSSDYTGEHVSDWLTDYSTHYDGVKDSADASDYPGDYTGYNTGHDSNYNGSYYYSDEGTVYIDDHGTYRSGAKTADNTSDYTSYCSTHRAGADATYNGTVHSTYFIGIT